MTSYLDSIVKSIEYIEKNLSEDISLKSVANEAGYSLYHFQRLFNAFIGDSIKDYIRKRRVTEAAKELVSNKQPIVDIAFKYGFRTRESFSRSFLRVYGRSPSQVRREGLLYYIREPMTQEYLAFEYNRRLRGMKPRFITVKSKTIVGKKYPVALDGTNYQEVPLLWNTFMKTDIYKSALKANKSEFFGVCILDKHSNSSFDYLIGYDLANKKNELIFSDIFTIDNIHYAVFTTLGPVTETVQKTWDYIYGIWLPNSQYRRTDEADIEHYYNIDNKQMADLLVPIAPK